jgi:hypothetical protein
MPAEKETAAPAEAKPIGLADMKDLAHKYQVPMAESTLRDIKGEGEMDAKKFTAFEDYLKTSAQGLYPSLAPQISAGIPTVHLLDPYRQVAKQTLGANFEPDFINDHRAAAALHGGTDEKTGRPTPMTLDQWRGHLMNEPTFGWMETPDAHARMNTMLTNLKMGLETNKEAK